jgi:hypothetical protein
MTTTAGHNFYIGPIGSFFNQVNDTGSWEPLVMYQYWTGYRHLCLSTPLSLYNFHRVVQ